MSKVGDTDDDEIFWNCHQRKDWTHKICHLAEGSNQLKTCKCFEDTCVSDEVTVSLEVENCLKLSEWIYKRFKIVFFQINITRKMF